MDVRYHQQDNAYYCGPATVLMLLDTTDEHARLPDESAVARTMGVTTDAGDYYTSPQQILDGLNHYVAPSLGEGRRFVKDEDDNIADAMRRIVQALRATDPIPPVALFHYANHWLVVTGIHTADQNGAGLACVFANSPTQRRSTSQSPHSRGDDCRIPPNGEKLAISYDYWQAMFKESAGVSLFLTITAPTKPGERRLTETGSIQPIETGGALTLPLDPREAALHIIHAYKLDAEGPQKDIMSNVDGVRTVEQVLDLALSVEYQCIPLKHGSDVVGVLSLDSTRSFMTAAQVYDGRAFGGAEPIVSADAAREIAIAFAARTFGDLDSPASTPDDPAGTATRLVWQPSAESVFPILPFYRVALGRAEVFVRWDGTPFHQLTPLHA